MKLRTLGGLSVEGLTFKREKVLLLLSYLCLEGPQPRKRLAELFWPEASNPMNSLAQHLVHLRGLPGAVKEEGSRVEACLDCDANELREAGRKGQAGRAAELYLGPFLDTLTIPLGADLEEWVYDTREHLALEARRALLTLAAQSAAHGQPQQAGEHAARALTLPGAPPADDLDLPRLWHLLTLAGHPLAAQVEREARTLGLTLTAAPERPTAPFLGREKELEALSALPPGHIAWLSGHAGMGKTALLEALARTGGWLVLPARQDLPYGTLEPLTHTPPTSLHAALQALRDPHLKLAIDDWAGMDAATQAVIAQAAKLRPGASLVVTCRRHPPFDVDLHLQLQPLSAEELRDHPGLHDLTDGHPTLISASLRGQSLDVKQGAKVRALPRATRDTYLLLALQDTPNLRATRAAMTLSADDFARTLSHLTQEGLTNESGRVYAAATARELLEQIQDHAKLLHLKLARALPERDAWPHYEAARDLWEEQDEDRAAKAAGLRAQALLRRGYPGKAAELLDTFTDRPEQAVTHAWALLGVGRYTEALKRLNDLDEHHKQLPELLVARATTLVRMGRVDEAVALAEKVTGSGAEAARAASVLAHAARIRERWAEARKYSQISADLWQLEGEEEQHVTELGMVAWARTNLGVSPAESFDSVISRAELFPSVYGTILLNYAKRLRETGNLENVSRLLQSSIEAFERSGDALGLAQALINLGVFRHLQGNISDAIRHYRRAIENLRGSGSIRTLGLALSNLSEIEGDLSSFEDVLEMLERADQAELVTQIRQNAKLLPQTQGQALRS